MGNSQLRTKIGNRGREFKKNPVNFRVELAAITNTDSLKFFYLEGNWELGTEN